MELLSTSIPDLKLLEPTVMADHRGFLMETWERESYAELGIEADFVLDIHSRSVRHTLRGLHYQIHTPQAKLVRVICGEVFDVAVDIRRTSPTFGTWSGVNLSEENKRLLWIPAGFAHGFLVLSETADFVYKCTHRYVPENDRSLLWCDPDLAIDWPIPPGVSPVLSARDERAPTLARIELE